MNSQSTAKALWCVSTFLACVGICQAAIRTEVREDKEKLVVLPFAIEGLDSSQRRILQQQFEQTLRESNSFGLLPEHQLRNALAEAGLERIDSCTSLPCLAQLGKVLNVQKVVHVQGMHAGLRYALRIRLVNAADAKLLYDESLTYAGEFNSLLFNAFAEHARRMDNVSVTTATPWYYYAAAVLIGSGIIYWIFSTWAASSSSESDNTPSTTTPK